jgi:hypothetical protein
MKAATTDPPIATMIGQIIDHHRENDKVKFNLLYSLFVNNFINA